MSGIRFRKWINEAGAGILSPEQLAAFRLQFLRVAANDCGGEKVRVPVLVSERTKALRAARMLVEVGASADDCEQILGETFCRATFYRWKAKIGDESKVIDALGQDFTNPHPACFGHVYALRFEGACGESYYKIGRSRLSPRERAKTICRQTDLVIVEASSVAFADFNGAADRETMNVEAMVHSDLADFRIDLEWFQIPHDMDWVIDRMVRCAKVAFDRQFVRRS